MTISYAEANGISLAYETFGERSDPPIVLVMGLGTQMIAWPDEFCAALADAGHFVVRYDNRDVGLSTHLREVRAPNAVAVVSRRRKPPYTIEDMADDLTGLLDALDLGRVHLVGASLGGFIAQTFALKHPKRLISLTLIMTSTGSFRVGRASPKLMRNLLTRRAVNSREEAIQFAVETIRLIGSPGFPFDEDRVRAMATLSYDRATDLGGYLRHLAAAAAQPDRTQALRSLKVPTLVMHGLKDPLVGTSGGLALARAIPRAKFVGYQGMGHDFPRALWPEFVAEILGLVRRATSADVGTRA